MGLDPAAEQLISKALEAGRLEDAAEAIVRTYGSETLGFLAAIVGTTDAQDLFGDVCERVWRNIGDFRHDAAARTWVYAIARHVIVDALRRKRVRQRRIVRASTERIDRAQAAVATRTMTFLKTETKDRFAELRKRLPLDDQTILILRVDRELSWAEVVTVLHDGGDPADRETTRRRVIALRKRFERTTHKLRDLARQEGLLGPER